MQQLKERGIYTLRSEREELVAHAVFRGGYVLYTPPRVMPWGQTVAYVQAPEGTIVGFVTRVGEAAAP